MSETKKKKASGHSSHKRRKKSHFSFFYLVYVLIIIAVVIATFHIKDALYSYLKDYEDAQPKYVAERAAEIFTSRDFNRIYEYEDPTLFGDEGREQYVDYMMALTEGKTITYREAASTDESVKRYSVRMDGEKLGEFSLRKTGEVNAHGFGLWGLDDMSTSVLMGQTYRVTAPTLSKVYVDGLQLDEDKIIERDIPILDVADNLPEGVSGPTQCTYEFVRFFGVKDVAVTDQYGVANPLTKDSEYSWSAAFNYDDDRFDQETEDRVIQVVRRLSCFMSDDYRRSSMYQDLIEGSNAYKYVKAFDNDWIASHKGYDFLNMEISNYVRYSEDVFSVEARYDYKIIYKRADPGIYPTAYRLFFTNVKGTWKLFDFELL